VAQSIGYGDLNADRRADIIHQDGANDFWASLQGFDWLPR